MIPNLHIHIDRCIRGTHIHKCTHVATDMVHELYNSCTAGTQNVVDVYACHNNVYHWHKMVLKITHDHLTL